MLTYTKLIGAPVLIGSCIKTVFAIKSSGGGIKYLTSVEIGLEASALYFVDGVSPALGRLGDVEFSSAEKLESLELSFKMPEDCLREFWLLELLVN